MTSGIILYFFVAILLGALIGLERDTPKTAKGVEFSSFGGVRTYALVSLFGGMMTAVSIFLDNLFFIFGGLFIISCFILTSYIYTVFKIDKPGLTTELSVLLTYLLGVLVVLGFIKIAVIMTIVITILLSLKSYVEKIKKNISYEEIATTLKFAAISIVVLPLLPNVKYSIVELLGMIGFEGAFHFSSAILTVPFFNPYGIWFFVVAMSAISYIGYILSKMIGAKSSIVASGAIGGLISSTAVTASMSDLSKKDTKNSSIYAISTLIASSIMFLRVIIIVLFFNINLMSYIIVPALLMFLGMGIFIIYYFIIYKRTVKREKHLNIENDFRSPFTVVPALKFALFVLGIKFLSAVGLVYKDIFGESTFYYALGVISGLADVDAISQTMAVDAVSGSVLMPVATITILIAIFSNNIVKGSMAYKFGDAKYGRIVVLGFLTSMVFGVVGIFASGLL